MGPGNRGGAITQLTYKGAPLFNHVLSQYFLHVGLCPTLFLPCRTHGGTIRVGFGRPWSQGVDRVDSSPRDHEIRHVHEKQLKWRRSRAHRRTRGFIKQSRFRIIYEDPHADTWTQMGRLILIKRAGMSSRTIFLGRWIAIKRWTLFTIGHTGSGVRNRPLTGSAIGWPRRVVEELHDRGLIKPRSLITRHGITSTSIGRRSLEHQYHDRRPIVARSWRDRGPIVAKIMDIWKRN